MRFRARVFAFRSLRARECLQLRVHARMCVCLSAITGVSEHALMTTSDDRARDAALVHVQGRDRQLVVTTL